MQIYVFRNTRVLEYLTQVIPILHECNNMEEQNANGIHSRNPCNCSLPVRILCSAHQGCLCLSLGNPWLYVTSIEIPLYSPFLSSPLLLHSRNQLFYKEIICHYFLCYSGIFILISFKVVCKVWWQCIIVKNKVKRKIRKEERVERWKGKVRSITMLLKLYEIHDIFLFLFV